MSERGDLSRASVEAVDPQGMIGDVLDLPTQLRDALWRVESAGIPVHEAPGGLLVCGMGGSAIGADLAAAAIGERARRPVRTLRDFDPAPLDPQPLVLCSSYSGETEETLACFEAAGAAGASRVVLTTGGALAEAARSEGVPVIGAPSGMQPRAAVAYSTVAALECAAVCGAAPSLRAELAPAAERLSALSEEWGPDGAADSEAKALARRLHGRLPVIYGGGSTAAAARRWKTQLNENAEVHAFWSTLPEGDHNELCGYGESAVPGAIHPVFLVEAGQHPGVRRRMELTAEVVAESVAEVEIVRARGEGALERVLSLVLLGDLTSVYLAVLGGVDPTPVDALVAFKQELR